MNKKNKTFRKKVCNGCDGVRVFVIEGTVATCTVCGYKKYYSERRKKYYDKPGD